MTNYLISMTSIVRHQASFWVTLLAILFTSLTVNSQIYEFGNTSFNKEDVSAFSTDLIINQTDGTVKVTMSFIASYGDLDKVIVDKKIAIVLINDKSEVVIGDSDKEFIAAIYINNSGTKGYFVYNDFSDDNIYQVDLSKPENYLATFKKLKQAVESGTFDKSSTKNSVSSTTSVSATSAGRLPAKGAKTADILATHPIGFLPPNCLSKSEVINALKKEGWPVNDHNAYSADINYKVPYTIYGTDVWAADMGFDKEKLTMYSFDTYHMTGNVTEKRILDYVGKFLSDLKKVGYQIVKHNINRETGDAHYYWTLSNGRDKVEITANSGGKVFFKVYPNSVKK